MYQPYQMQPPPPRRPVWPWVVAVLLYVLYWAPAPAPGRPYFPFYGGSFLLVFVLIMVAFFVLRIALWTSYRGRYAGNRAGQNHPMRDPAVMAARQRYARGEITREQYEQIMSDIGRHPRGPGPYPPP